jgi:hypothetical protein
VRRAFGAQPRLRLATISPAWWLVVAGVVLAYGVLRNIPAAPFRALAP